MTKITFEDLPSTNTPLSASNLNTLQDNVESAINGTISNSYGTSQTIGYSQNYVNDLTNITTGSSTIDISTTAVELNKYAKYGKVVALKLTLTITNQVSANATTQIAHDLPTPNSIYGNNGWEFFGVSKSDKSNIRCRIDEGGKLTFGYLNNQIAAGTQLYFFTTYISN